MASGFFAILDDIAALMDDVAVTSKIATQKTAGILGDDLAVNAEKATGFVSSRELPVLWKITKGSFLNKVIIVPIALVLNAFFPPALPVILVIGGLYLGYEGVEKVLDYFFHKNDLPQKAKDLLAEDIDEPEKVKSAVRTDFILSIEIVIIALGSVVGKPLGVQITSVVIVSILATVGVYGLVALIVRMDDVGYRLISIFGKESTMGKLGNILVIGLPWVIRVLAVVGTLALILVAGGIFHHHIPALHHFMDRMPEMVAQTVLGLLGGSFAVVLVFVTKRLIRLFSR